MCESRLGQLHICVRLDMFEGFCLNVFIITQFTPLIYFNCTGKRGKCFTLSETSRFANERVLQKEGMPDLNAPSLHS